MKNLKIITVAALTGIGTTRVLVWINNGIAAVLLMSNGQWSVEQAAKTAPWILAALVSGLAIWANFKEPCVGQCYMPKKSLYNIWVEKLVALCSATGREAPKFITDKAGECW